MKFTDLSKQAQTEEVQTKYKSDSYNIINFRGWDIITESPVVIILPYMRDENAILLRSEPVPTYQYLYKDTEYKSITHFITCISGTVQKGEKLTNAVRRELSEEAGIVLADTFEINEDKALFMSKGNASMYHIYFLEIGYNDYRMIQPTGDGSEHEKNSKTIKIDFYDIDEIRTHDLITDYLLNSFRLKYPELFKKKTPQ